jgi:hypothetical protein
MYRYVLPGGIAGSAYEFDFDNPFYNINQDMKQGTILGN